jgi:hypothetical protein
MKKGPISRWGLFLRRARRGTGAKALAKVRFNAGLKAGSSTVVLAVVKLRKEPALLRAAWDR